MLKLEKGNQQISLEENMEKRDKEMGEKCRIGI